MESNFSMLSLFTGDLMTVFVSIVSSNSNSFKGAISSEVIEISL